jgi:hypothetical protein
MTHVALKISLVLALLADGPAWGPVAPSRREQCPYFMVSCPESVIAGQPATFTVMIMGGHPSWEPTFNWTVSAGAITGGQKTGSITVDTTGIKGRAIEATVTVGNMMEPCPKTASCSASIPPGCDLKKIDEYGDINRADEKARLDNFAVELRNDPTAQGYVIVYGGRRGRAGEAERRAARILDYLFQTLGAAAGRFVTVDGGLRETLSVELYIVPAGGTPPTPSPTVDPSAVKITPEQPAPKRPARQPRRRS